MLCTPLDDYVRLRPEGEIKLVTKITDCAGTTKMRAHHAIVGIDWLEAVDPDIWWQTREWF